MYCEYLKCTVSHSVKLSTIIAIYYNHASRKKSFCCNGNSNLIDFFLTVTFNYIQPDALECAEFKYAIDFQIGSSIKKL